MIKGCKGGRVAMLTSLLFFLFLAHVTAAFSGTGAGSRADPYQITNVTQLQEMRYAVTSYYVLMNNIDASDTSTWNSGAGFDSIGNLSVRFSGNFDGGGYNITGLFINRTGTDYIGLFGITSTSVESNFSDVGLVNVQIYGKGNVGALIGYNLRSNINNSFSTGIVTAAGTVGGLAGYSVPNSGIGGTINNSYSTVNVTSNTSGSGAGGLVGHNEGQIIYSYATGFINGKADTGGLVGSSIETTALVKYSYATGIVNGTTFVGGLIGENTFGSKIYNSYSLSNVNGSGSYVGGLVGFSQGGTTVVNNSFARGYAAGGSGVGGLVGTVDSNSGTPVIHNSYSTGNVTGSSSLGGLAGGSTNAVCLNNFWDNQTSGQSSTKCSSLTGTGKTTTEMKDVVTFTSTATRGLNISWDYWSDPYNDTGSLDHWHINSAINDGYPFLLGFGIGNISLPEISYNSPSTAAGIIAQDWIAVNVTSSGLNLSTLSILFYNSTDLVQQNNTESTSLFVNFTGLSNGRYYVNATLNDTSGNTAKSKRTIILDTTTPSATLNLPQDGSNYTTRTITFNASVADSLAGLKNASLLLNGTINQTNTSLISGEVLFNVTFGDGDYNWSISVYDAAGNLNQSAPYKVRVDGTVPLVQFLNPTTNMSNLSQLYIEANVTASDGALSNISLRLYNATALINETVSAVTPYFVNFTLSRDGIYYLNATANDTFGNLNSTETRTITLDTTSPRIDLTSPTSTNNSNVSANSIIVNASALDATSGVGTVILRFYNSTRDLIQTNTSSGGVSSFYVNLSGLSDGLYYYNATVNDSAGNTNSTETRSVTLDQTIPLISYGTGTLANLSNVSQGHIFINVSVTESNFFNITFQLTNSTGEVNSTTYSTSVVVINWTGLPAGLYYYNVTVSDRAGNINYTDTRVVTLDQTIPLISYATGTLANNSNVSQNYVFVNVSITEANFANITFQLTNSTGEVNSTTYSASVVVINWTSLSDGSYYYNVTVRDRAGNINSTLTRVLNLDVVAPSITLVEPVNSTSSTTNAYNFTFNVSDSNIITDCSLILDDTIINSLTTLDNGGTNGMYNSSLSVASHTWSVNCTDNAGNIANSSRYNLTITASTSQTTVESNTQPVRDNGVSGGYISNVYYANEQFNSDGNSYSLKLSDRIRFAVDLTNHTLTLNKFNSSGAQVTIQSKPMVVYLEKGVEAEFDLNYDGVNDVTIKYEGVHLLSRKAKLFIQKKIPTKVQPVQQEEIVIQSNSPSLEEKLVISPEVKSERKKNYTSYLIILIIFIAMAFLLFSKEKKQGPSLGNRHN